MKEKNINQRTIRNGIEYLSTHKVTVLEGACICTELRSLGATKKDFDEIHRRSPNFNNKKCKENVNRMD